MARFLLCFVTLLLVFLCMPVSAHQMSTAYLNIEQQANNRLVGSWQIRWYDLNQAIRLDDDQDGKLTWSEVMANQQYILTYLSSQIQIGNASESCSLNFDPALHTDQHFNEGYLVSVFTADCPTASIPVLQYRALFEQNQEHKVLLSYRQQSASISSVLTADTVSLALNPLEQRWQDTLWLYLVEGVVHIWIGLDHILFLLALLLTATLVRKPHGWSTQVSTKQALKNTLWIVTAFTLAHSITLTATAMNWIGFDTTYVELLIALSVLFAALNNIWPLVIRMGWVTFAFGLIHGFGFASVLSELGLSKQQTLLSVVAFNLGVELGQLIILLAIFPALLWVGKRPWYIKGGMQCLSAGIGAVAIFWSLQRL